MQTLWVEPPYIAYREYLAADANCLDIETVLLAPVVQKLDSAIHWINLYSADNAIGFPNTYPLDSDLSVG